LELSDWRPDDVYGDLRGRKLAATEEDRVTVAIRSFGKTNGAKFVAEIAQGLATYDWRTSSTPGLQADERLRQSVFRGSSGYKEMRRQLLAHLMAHKGAVGEAAEAVSKSLGYE
jgi:hypothetical protein